jgi:predicted amidophosphoribosyltransferase
MQGSADHPVQESAREPSGSPPRFVWPPRLVKIKKAPDSQTGSLDIEAPPPRSTWAQVERTWLGLTTPPFIERCRDLGWAPDEAADYCPRCGQGTGAYEVAADGCGRCQGARPPWKRLVRLGAYQGPLADFVREVKFTAFRRLGSQLGQELGMRLSRAVADARVAGDLAPGGRVLIVPVPSSFRRRVARGIDHSAVIGRAAARACGGRVWMALARAHRPAQVSMSVSQRARNVAGSMRPGWVASRRARGLAANDLVVVLDDVKTTGATLREACRALRGAFGEERPQVWAAALAVTLPPGRSL